MGQALGAKDAVQDGTTVQSSNGHTIPPPSVAEQFFTRTCARCAGLLVNDWCNDLSYTDERSATGLRCVQCGHRIDPVILLNQYQSTDENRRVRRARHKQSLRTVTVG